MTTSPQKSIEQTAYTLARAHREQDPETTKVLFATDSDAREIRLIEVSGSVATTGEILPFRFREQPDSGIPYPTTVVLVSLDDWERVKSGELSLPDSWGKPDSFTPLDEEASA